MKKIETQDEINIAIDTQDKRYNDGRGELITIDYKDDIEYRLKRALDKVLEFETKYERLVWYARKDSYKLLEEERYEILKSISDIKSLYQKETSDLSGDDSNWHHGFNSGMLAACRLFSGMLEKQYIEEQEEVIEDIHYINEEGVPFYLYDSYEDSVEEFPFLDT